MVQDLMSLSTNFIYFLKRFDHINSVVSTYIVR